MPLKEYYESLVDDDSVNDNDDDSNNNHNKTSTTKSTRRVPISTLPPNFQQRRTITTYAAPGLMTLIDTALYRAHEGQLTSTVSSANATLVAFLQLKSHAKRLLYECQTMSPPLSFSQFISCVTSSSASTRTSPMDNTSRTTSSTMMNEHKQNELFKQVRKTHLEHVSTLTSFASFCIDCANDAIDRLTTDQLSKSANCYAEEPMATAKAGHNVNMNVDDVNATSSNPTATIASVAAAVGSTVSSPNNSSRVYISPSKERSSSNNQNKRKLVEEGISLSKYNSWNEIGIRARCTSSTTSGPSCTGTGNNDSSNYLFLLNIFQKFIGNAKNDNKNDDTETTSNNQHKNIHNTTTNNNPYHKQRQKDCWESESLYCPDYVWADDAMLHCQRMIRSIMKHDTMDCIIDFVLQMKANPSNVLFGQKNVYPMDETGNGSRFGDDQSGLSSIFLPFLSLSSSPSSSSAISSSTGISSYENQKQREKLLLLLTNILTLLKNDIPLRLHQFRCGIESDTAVTKRLYLLKNECRAPFRVFLEGHDHLQRVPDKLLVNQYIGLHEKYGELGSGSGGGGDDDTLKLGFSNSFASEKDDEEDNALADIEESGDIIKILRAKKKIAEKKIQECIKNNLFQESLKLEYQCEMLEIEMGMILLPFCNLARVLLDSKVMFHLVEVPDVLHMDDVVELQELLRRLKCILCKKPGVHLSTGIRPLLLDLEGLPRDPTPSSLEIQIFGDNDMANFTRDEAIDKRLEVFMEQLHCLQNLCKSKNGFGIDKKEFEGLNSAMKTCSSPDLDVDSFKTKFKEWYSLCLKQHEQPKPKQSSFLSDDLKVELEKTLGTKVYKETMGEDSEPTLHDLAEKMRKAEIEVSIAIASRQQLSLVQQKIDQLEKDRMKRFEILQDILEEVCLREMDFHLNLRVPKKDAQLELPLITSVSGIFDAVLEVNGVM